MHANFLVSSFALCYRFVGLEFRLCYLNSIYETLNSPAHQLTYDTNLVAQGTHLLQRV